MRLECTVLPPRPFRTAKSTLVTVAYNGGNSIDVAYFDDGETPPERDCGSPVGACGTEQCPSPIERVHGGLISPDTPHNQSLESWVAQLYQHHHQCQAVYASPDGREGVFLARNYANDKTAVRNGHVLVGVRLVQFSDQQHLVSWCSRPQCQGSLPGRQLSLERAALYERLDYPKHHSSTAVQENPCGLYCTCGTAICEALGGVGGLATHLQHVRDSSGEQSGPFIQPVKLVGRQLYVVNGGSSFEGWGAVVRKPSGACSCKTCTRNTTCCGHVKLLQGERPEEPQPAVAPLEKLNEKLRNCLAEDGTWKVRCISRHSLPWNISDDLHLNNIYTGRNSGRNQIPPVCTPDASQPCPECGSCLWGPPTVPSGASMCLVFHKGAASRTQFAVAHCTTPDCDGRIEVDGYEYGILRQSPQYAFCHTLLYSWRHQLVPVPSTWYTFWRRTLQDYKDASQQDLKLWMVRTKQFEQATKDFINLMNLDWDQGFRCPHKHRGGVILDGITLGFKISNACFASPWEADQEGPVVWGSHFQERILVHDHKLRTAIGQFAELGPDAVGLSEDAYEAMLAKVERLPSNCPEHALLPFLSNPTPSGRQGHVRAPQRWRSMLYSVSCAHPISRFIKAPLFGLVEKLVHGQELGIGEVALMLRCAPLLHEFLRDHLAAGEVPEDVRVLLQKLLVIAKQAVVPQKRRDTVPPPLQRARKLAATSQPAASAAMAPESWSRDEAFLRTGCFSAFHAGVWAPTALGGSDIVRQPRLYGADYQAAAEDSPGCNKPGSQHAALLPGCLFYYCLCCRLCIGFHVMASVESPKMPFTFFYTRCEESPAIVVYDNGCNQENYCLAREPEFFGAVDFYVDASHWVTHTSCPPAYSSASNPAIVCSPLAEQKNAFIGVLRGMLSSADQPTFLWFVRLYMYAMNLYEVEKAAGRCFYFRPQVKVKRPKKHQQVLKKNVKRKQVQKSRD